MTDRPLARRRRWKRRLTVVAAGLLLAFVGLNVLAYRHAHALTHFGPPGARPAPPDGLSTWGKLKLALGGRQYPRPQNRLAATDLDPRGTVHRFAAADGVALEAWHLPARADHPRGTVLLFHGFTACKDTLAREAGLFQRLGFAAFLVDFRACGGSGGAVTTVGLAEADDVAAACAYVARTWGGPQVIYGVSMGAAAALRAVSAHGVRPAAVVVECPFDTLVNAVKARCRIAGAPQPLAYLLCFWGGRQLGCDPFAHDVTAYARAVTCPVLHLQGARDSRVRVAEAKAVFENLAGPKRFELFESVGHHAIAGREPERWRALVGRFLDEYVPVE
jgi:alpha-beta hydrolase superfamily lysophospholipase